LAGAGGGTAGAGGSGGAFSASSASFRRSTIISRCRSPPSWLSSAQVPTTTPKTVIQLIAGRSRWTYYRQTGRICSNTLIFQYLQGVLQQIAPMEASDLTLLTVFYTFGRFEIQWF
jgi:hypothetical protein